MHWPCVGSAVLLAQTKRFPYDSNIPSAGPPIVRSGRFIGTPKDLWIHRSVFPNKADNRYLLPEIYWKRLSTLRLMLHSLDTATMFEGKPSGWQVYVGFAETVMNQISMYVWRNQIARINFLQHFFNMRLLIWIAVPIVCAYIWILDCYKRPLSLRGNYQQSTRRLAKWHPNFRDWWRNLIELQRIGTIWAAMNVKVGYGTCTHGLFSCAHISINKLGHWDVRTLKYSRRAAGRTSKLRPSKERGATKSARIWWW